jgi:uncharacterized delta-60 repeat protein
MGTLSMQPSLRRARARHVPKFPSARVVDALEPRTLLSAVSFAAQATYPVGVQPRAVVPIDLGNGQTDLLVGNSSDDTVSVLLGNGDGTFGTQTTYSTDTDAGNFTVGDLGNGRADLILSDPTDDTVRVRLGNGDGTFGPEGTPISITNVPAGTPFAVAFADLGDPHPDLIVTGLAHTIDILPGNVNGTFGTLRTITTTAASPGVTVADVNGDGRPDLVVEDEANNDFSVMLNQGNDTFGAERVTPLTISPTALVVADLGNGHPDVLVTHYLALGYGAEGNVGVLLGNGDGTFGAETDYDAGNGAYAIAVADLGDGHPDVVVNDVSGNAVDVLPGNGDGTLQAGQLSFAGATPYSPAVADVNGDGLPDILLADGDSNAVGVLLNTAPGHLTFARQPADTASGATLASITVDVDNAAGGLRTTATSDVTLTISSGGTLLGTTTVAAVNGVATFSNLSISTVGNYTLTASDAGDASATSDPFLVVTPRLAFVAQPASSVFRTPLGTVAVDVTNPIDGMTLTSGVPTVTLTIDDDAGNTVDTATVTAVAGVATFAGLPALPIGTYTLVATAAGDTTATSSPFTVAARQLAFAGQPAVAVMTGATLGTITVDVVSPATGALLTDDASNVALTLTGGTGTLAGSATAVAAGGVATFANLTVSAPGTYRLSASVAGGNYTAAGSTGFTATDPLVVGVAVNKSIGKPDPSFGIGGVAAHDVGFTATSGVAVDGTGSVLIGTVGSGPTASFGLTRYAADGSLDTTFGTAGVTVTAFAGYGVTASAVDALPDGDLLVAGTATAYAADGTTVNGSLFAVAEYTAAGTLDSAFGTGGTVTFGFGPTLTDDVLRTMAVASDGTIYLGGRTDLTGTTAFAVAALTSAGVPKSTFGTDGKVTVGDGGDAAIAGLAVDARGDVIAAGSAVVGADTEVAVVRLLPSGTLDTKFGTKGVVNTANTSGIVYEAATSVAIDGAGHVVVGGLASGATSTRAVSADLLVRRYATTGKLDKTFGAGGTVLTTLGQPAAVTSVLADADGTIVASGRTASTLGGVQDLVVARYTAKGTLDPTFGGTGVAVVNLGGGGLAGGSAAMPSVRRASVMHRLAPATATDLGAAFDAFAASAQGAVTASSTGEILATGQAGSDSAEVELVAAGLDLAAAVLSANPTTILAGKRVTVTITVTEAGTVHAVGSVTIAVTFTADATAAGTGGAAVTKRINLRGGQGKSFKLAVASPTSAGAWYATATVTDGSGLSGELNAANNSAVDGKPVMVTVAISKGR